MVNYIPKGARLVDSYYDGNDDLHEQVKTVQGSTLFFKNGEFHRAWGPAVIDADGGTTWFYNGKRHRASGPAVEEPDGTKEFWRHGVKVLHELSEPWASWEKKNA